MRGKTIDPDPEFAAAARENVQSLEKSGVRPALWHFHTPVGHGLLRAMVRNTLLRFLWLVACLAAPWALDLLSFTVAHALCVLFVFVVWPVYWLLELLRKHPLMHLFRAMPKAFGTVGDLCNVLACYVYLIAKPGALWSDLFTSATGAFSFFEWARFVGDSLCSVVSLGATSEMGLSMSSIMPVGWRGGLVKFGLNLLIAGSIWQQLKNSWPWYRGNEFFTGTEIELIGKCREREEVPGSFVSRVAVFAEADRRVFEVKTLAEHAPQVAQLYHLALSHLAKPIFPKMEDKRTYGEAAFTLLRITHVDVETVRRDGAAPVQSVLNVYHMKTIPTFAIETRLDLNRAAIEFSFNHGKTVVETPALRVLREIAPGTAFAGVNFFQVSDLKIVGHRFSSLTLADAG